MRTEMNKMLDKQAISEVRNCSEDFYSDDSSNKERCHASTCHKPQTQSVSNSPGDLMANIDPKDAYFIVLMARTEQF